MFKWVKAETRDDDDDEDGEALRKLQFHVSRIFGSNFQIALLPSDCLSLSCQSVGSPRSRLNKRRDLFAVVYCTGVDGLKRWDLFTDITKGTFFGSLVYYLFLQNSVISLTENGKIRTSQ